MSITIRTLGVLGLAATLAACGQTPVERAATGAAGGAALATVVGEDAVGGALIGAAAGGIGTCLFNPNATGCY